MEPRRAEDSGALPSQGVTDGIQNLTRIFSGARLSSAAAHARDPGCSNGKHCIPVVSLSHNLTDTPAVQKTWRQLAAPRSVAGMGMPSDAFSQFKKAIETPDVPLLGPQQRADVLPVKELELKLAAFFSSARIDSHVQPLLRSAALLWHDHLDASHTVSQDIETRDGSWLHGIMHRRERDYGNAKYWFRRVGEHEAFATLAQRVAALLQKDSGGLTERLIENGEWQAFAFIDECERAEESGDASMTTTLRRVQAAEFDVLVEHILS